MGLISRIVIVRPPCSCVVLERTSRAATWYSGFGGAGGGGVPSGISPRMRAVVGSAKIAVSDSPEAELTSSCECARVAAANRAGMIRNDDFMGRRMMSFLVDGGVQKLARVSRNGL